MSDMNEKFKSLKNATDAADLLDRFRNGLTGMKDNENAMSDHIMLVFANQVFRGGDGSRGMAEALRGYYGARGNSMKMASGMTIQDIAGTLTEDYVHIIYGRNTPEEGITGTVFRGNYPGELSYGGAHMFVYGVGNSPDAHPAMDCSGFVNAVYHSAGMLDDDTSMGEGLKAENGDLVNANRLAGWENTSVQNTYENDIFTFLDALQKLDTNKQTLINATHGSGVHNTAYNENVIPVSDPIPGDLMMMQGANPRDVHIGIYGVDGNTNLMIHSAPNPILWDLSEEYDSGPRINEFINLTDIKTDGNDGYIKALIDRGYFSNWERNYTFQYVRWNYDK